ncbi:hypothetical protein ACHHYP_13052 [Achlya hypogyna]|uniref:Uncharacterized protein n=1 Tax=Achlya hypogyna TaxID=1202772 RepID=A0A1V9YG25_ACHHY|nr:hypothetical protein ACHHYP_13052 [Achlya hypogyna]
MIRRFTIWDSLNLNDLADEAESLGAFLAKLEERAAHRARLAVDDTLASSEETMQRVYQAFMDNMYDTPSEAEPPPPTAVTDPPLEAPPKPSTPLRAETPKKTHTRPPRRAQSATKKAPVTLSREVQGILRRHRELQIKRSAIMTHPNVRKWLRTLWSSRIRAKDEQTMSKNQYITLYSQLLSGLTTEWHDGIASALLNEAWESDSHGQTILTVDCFCDAMFFFVEQWVEEPDLGAYVALLKRMNDILNEKHVAPVESAPTLEQYQAILVQQSETMDMGIALGKSISFDPVLYLQRHNGTPSSPTHAVPKDEGSLAYLHCPIKSRAQIQIKVDAPRTSSSHKTLPHL